MKDVKIAVIGAGSSYTPELVEKLSEMRERLPVRELSLMDIDERRLREVAGFCGRFARRLGWSAPLTATTDRARAVEGADFVVVQLRVGGNAARINDEKIPLMHGCIGQETTGPGGFMKALRTIPVLLDVAADVERLTDGAWIVNYTNPTGMVTEAITRHTRARVAGLCAGGNFARDWAQRALGADPASVRYDYFGLNHLAYSYNVTINGRPITDTELDLMALQVGGVDAGLIRALGLLPSPYLQYYHHTAARLEKLRAARQTRGEVVLSLERETFSAYADPACDTKPDSLRKRGGGGYSDVAIGLMDAIRNNRDAWMVVNVPNGGAVRCLPEEAVVEIGCLVNASGVHPLALRNVPAPVWGLVAAVKNYEQLAVEAAVTGNRRIAALALAAHPLVRDWDVVEPLLDELLEANREYLPRFFTKKNTP